MDSFVLTINGGSSSIKFSFCSNEKAPKQILVGQIESIGTKKSKLHFTDTRTGKENSIAVKASSQAKAAGWLFDWLEKQDGFEAVRAIGHRIVHGMNHSEPELITPSLLKELKKISAYDPEHLPGEIALIEICRKRFPQLKQIACFDTSFHASMPEVAKLLPIPKKFRDKGVQRYGFHGLSYAYLMQAFSRVAGASAAKGKIILAHLGNGASIAAVKNGKSMDTSMGLTPASGLPMSTRTGDMDPGVAWYMMQAEKMSPKKFSHLINHEAGLLAISGISSDMRDLLQAQKKNKHAAEAIEYFCYQVRKWIGAYAAALAGVDTLIFAGGIGEHAPEVRSRICNGLQFLGIELDKAANKKNQPVISASASRVSVRVMKTNEELMIAKLVCQMISH